MLCMRLAHNLTIHGHQVIFECPWRDPGCKSWESEKDSKRIDGWRRSYLSRPG